MKKIILIFLFAVATIVSVGAFAKDVYVKGYYKSNGTYVQPHYRSQPDGYQSNNWTTKGNTNPYTGQVGSREPDYFYSQRNNSRQQKSNCTGLLC